LKDLQLEVCIEIWGEMRVQGGRKKIGVSWKKQDRIPIYYIFSLCPEQFQFSFF
jgi:hypothetical protein